MSVAHEKRRSPVEVFMEGRVEALLAALNGADEVLILPHNDPDPDAIASAMALCHILTEKIGVQGEIAYRGIVGRAENRALVRYLGKPMRRLVGSDLRQKTPIALVDTQPGAGNNALPVSTTPAIVIDHHALRDETSIAAFADVRPGVGATSTILTEYLQEAGIEPDPALATALFYGIKTDTMGLGRGATDADIAAYFYLQPRIDVEALVEIERAQVPADYFKSFDATLQTARVYDGAVISYTGPMGYPDLAAEMADLLLRLEGSKWVICMGVYKDTLILAVRTRSRRGGAGRLVQKIVGDDGSAGGHGTLAGGQIPLRGRNPEELAQAITQRILEHLKLDDDDEGQPLV
ncbi:MAG: DHH family phosphoesterase [Herpetosiphonaceae bacterium]|nr:MAG: DHH family phosphoesterase [Herpetosiphonaceae bacterium]